MDLGPIEQLRGDEDRPVALLDASRPDDLRALTEAPGLALDLESDNFHAYREKVCLLQVALPTQDYFFDALTHGMPPVLARELERRDRPLFVHAGDNDVRALKRDFGLPLGTLFDTALAARILGLPYLGLRDLLESELDVRIDKAEQRSDWAQRPLTVDQLRYARQDVRWLIPLANRLAQRLASMGRTSWHAEECERARAAAPTTKVFDEESWRRVKAAKGLGPRGRSVMAAIWAWRESEAERRNLAPFRVSYPEQMARVAKVADAHGEKALAKVDDFRFLPTDLDRDGLRRAIEAGLGRPDPGPRRPPKPPSGPARAPLDEQSKTRLTKLREGRDRWSRDLGIEPGFLINNQILERIARQAPKSGDDLRSLEGLGEWRAEVLSMEILDAVRL